MGTHVRPVSDNVCHHVGRGDRPHRLEPDRLGCRTHGRASGDYIIDNYHRIPERRSRRKCPHAAGMVPPSSSRRMKRGQEEIVNRHLETLSQSRRDRSCRVDPVLEPARQGARHRDEWDRRETIGQDFGDQICVEGDTPVFEMVHQRLRHPNVLEGGVEPETPRQDAWLRGAESTSACRAQHLRRDLVTTETDHPPWSTTPLGQFASGAGQATSVTRLSSGSATYATRSPQAWSAGSMTTGTPSRRMSATISSTSAT
jgi:hypothetical protein